QHAQVIYGQDANYILPMFAALAVLYFITCFGLSLVGNWIDRHLA
ncbi:amino acid ABC transporter permease, partial [Lactobacillus sp. DCY120]|nr:amino acid ABC transporter permease [Bombilactobacillus apium]NVY97002.1 amino acid ABC transporter permease [Bombilactobacillus apium]